MMGTFIMQRIFLSCLVALIMCPATSIALNRSSRIVRGTVTTIDKVPYVVQLRHIGGLVFCEGALIAPPYVLTAAHCFNDYFYRQVTVVGGANTLSDRGVQRDIQSIDLHPDYNRVDFHTDVAIAKLSKPMTGKDISTVPLCKQPLNVGDFVQISGWGKTSIKSEMSNELQTARISVISSAECKRKFGKYVTKNMFCGSDAGGSSICLGDSGGPVIYNGQVCGINAFNFECGNPSAYTDVYSLRNYIAEALQDSHVLDWDY